MSNRLYGNDPEQFGKDLFKAHKQATRGIFGIFGAFFAVWLVWALISIALLGGVVYVAWHFISKFW